MCCGNTRSPSTASAQSNSGTLRVDNVVRQSALFRYTGRTSMTAIGAVPTPPIDSIPPVPLPSSAAKTYRPWRPFPCSNASELNIEMPSPRAGRFSNSRTNGHYRFLRYWQENVVGEPLSKWGRLPLRAAPLSHIDERSNTPMIHIAPNHGFPTSLALVRTSRFVASAENLPAPPPSLCASVDSRALAVLKHAAFCFSLWVTMPLAIWLCSGWVGLFILLQAFLAAANLPALAPRTSLPDPRKVKSAENEMSLGTKISPGESPCALLNAKTL